MRPPPLGTWCLPHPSRTSLKTTCQSRLGADRGPRRLQCAARNLAICASEGRQQRKDLAVVSKPGGLNVRAFTRVEHSTSSQKQSLGPSSACPCTRSQALRDGLCPHLSHSGREGGVQPSQEQDSQQLPAALFWRPRNSTTTPIPLARPGKRWHPAVHSSVRGLFVYV